MSKKSLTRIPSQVCETKIHFSKCGNTSILKVIDIAFNKNE